MSSNYEDVVELASRHRINHGRNLTEAEWERLRSESCGMCGEPYHRYCDHDPEHEWSGSACINSLHAHIDVIAPTWLELRTPPSQGGSWRAGEPNGAVKRRWVYCLRPDERRGEALMVRDDALNPGRLLWSA